MPWLPSFYKWCLRIHWGSCLNIMALGPCWEGTSWHLTTWPVSRCKIFPCSTYNNRPTNDNRDNDESRARGFGLEFFSDPTSAPLNFCWGVCQGYNFGQTSLRLKLGRFSWTLLISSSKTSNACHQYRNRLHESLNFLSSLVNLLLAVCLSHYWPMNDLASLYFFIHPLIFFILTYLDIWIKHLALFHLLYWLLLGSLAALNQPYFVPVFASYWHIFNPLAL